MADGMNLPVKASKAGGTEFIKSSNQKQKILIMALSVGDDKNPFQDLGIKERSVFGLEDQATIAEITLEVRRILRKFSDTVEVDPNFPITVVKDPERGFGVEFKWINLETNEVGDFSQFLNNPGVANG